MSVLECISEVFWPVLCTNFHWHFLLPRVRPTVTNFDIWVEAPCGKKVQQTVFIKKKKNALSHSTNPLSIHLGCVLVVHSLPSLHVLLESRLYEWKLFCFFSSKGVKVVMAFFCQIYAVNPTFLWPVWSPCCSHSRSYTERERSL